MAKFIIEYTNGDVEELITEEHDTVESLITSKFGGIDYGHKITIDGAESTDAPVKKAKAKK